MISRKEAHRIAHKVVERMYDEKEKTPADLGMEAGAQEATVCNEPPIPTRKYTVAAEAWDQINRNKRRLCVLQVGVLITKDEELRAQRKKLQELIRQINVSDEPLAGMAAKEAQVPDYIIPERFY